MPLVPLSNTMMAILSVHVTALAVFLTVYSRGLFSMCCLNFLGFAGVGAVDCFATVALCEMWGQRIQPWMQGKSVIFALGAAIPSLAMAKSNLNRTCLVSAALCLSSVVGLIFDRIYWAFVKYKSDRTSTMISESQLFASPVQSKHSMAAPTRTKSHIPTIVEEDYTASDLVLLEHGFDSLKSNARKSTISEMVVHILDATEYCNVSMEQRNDPFFEPGIIKTLAYATPALINKVRALQLSGDPPFTLAPKAGVGLLMVFICLGSALQCTYNNWIPLVASSVSSSDIPPLLVAGHISCVLHVMGALGCLLSVPLSIYFSTTSLLRMHIMTVVFAFVALLFCQNRSYKLLSAATALMGFGVMPIMPLSLTVLNDYGYTMDRKSIILVIMSSAIGKTVAPLALGFAITSLGPRSITYTCAIVGGALVVVYAGLHVYILHREDINTQPSLAPTAGRPFNTYQRAQSILYDTRKGNGGYSQLKSHVQKK